MSIFKKITRFLLKDNIENRGKRKAKYLNESIKEHSFCLSGIQIFHSHVSAIGNIWA
jgi:hypothetical protein